MEKYVFVQEGHQFSQIPAFHKKVPKCIRNRHQNDQQIAKKSFFVLCVPHLKKVSFLIGKGSKKASRMETHFHQKNINFHELASVGLPGVPPETPKYPRDPKKHEN